MEGEMEELSGRTRSYPRDFLRRFAETSCYGEDANKEVVARGDAGEIELSLGLSLNGCFGVDTKEKRLGLVRSSSIASLPMLGHHFMDVAPLTRTCSLPTEAEEELRKREEMQRLKRLQAKRKRAEKRNSSKPCAKDLMDESVGEAMHERLRIVSPTRTKSGRMEVELNGCSEKPVSNQLGRPVNGWPAAGGWVGGQISRQVSIGSQGSAGSSCLSDFEHHPIQDVSFFSIDEAYGTSHRSHARQFKRKQYNKSQDNEDRLKPSPAPLLPLVGKPKTASEESCKKTSARTNGMREMERNVMEEMPCVSTKGDGPNGRRIEGFLYKYRKGEEVRIVCVCHGRFLTPAEFVRHAGGGDVDHPLRHIVVYPTSSSFL